VTTFLAFVDSRTAIDLAFLEYQMKENKFWKYLEVVLI
jgi:hypothetical protein